MPFVKLLMAFSGGIMLEYYTEPGWLLWISLCICSLIFLLAPAALSLTGRFRFRSMITVAGFICVLGTGGLLMWHRDPANQPGTIINMPARERVYLAQVMELPEEKTSSWKYTARLISSLDSNSWQASRGLIFIYLRKSDSTVRRPAYGERILFRGMALPIQGIGNPGSFDYGAYCHLKGITHQVFLKEMQYVILPGSTSLIDDALVRWRERILATVRRFIPGKKEQGLAEALLIGYRNDLDRSLVKAYADTGVVHIIAISGLHIGLIYWMLGVLLRPASRGKMTYPTALLKIVLLWLFSLMAGGQPSILRATVMFTCIIIEKEISGRGFVFNSIAFSAFVLLCIDPRWLWDAGFQLSYAAVLGIICFHKPICQVFYFRNPIASAAWNMSAVTLAAQALTLPFCLYYFHQFPNYFLVTNFIAVPLSSLILFGEIALLLLSFWTAAAETAGKLLGWTIARMNDCMEFFAGLPFATWKAIHISIAQGTCLLIFAWFAGFALVEKSGSAFRVALCSLFLFFTLRTISFFEAARKDVLIVYNTYGKTAIDRIQSGKVVFTGDTSLSKSSEERAFMIEPARNMLRCTSVFFAGNPGVVHCWQVGTKRVIRISATIRPVPGKKIAADIVILSGRKPGTLKNLQNVVDFRLLVLEPTVPPWISAELARDCHRMRKPVHDVRTAGAFVITGR